jgi:recombinational DNA repair protein RecR
VFDGLYPDRVMFSGNSLSAKKLYLLCDRDPGNYNVITNLKAAMAKTYICNDCDTLYDHTHKCDKVCSLCTATPPCTKDQSKYCGNVTDGFSVRSVSRIIQSQSERQASLSVETSMLKLFIFGKI